MKATIENGVMLQSNADALEAEILKIEQNIDDIQSGKMTAINILSELTGKKIDSDITLDIPQINFRELPKGSMGWPEFKLFVYTKEQLDKTSAISDTKEMPKVYFYRLAMYCRPGLNMFDPDFQTYYIVGVKADWKL